MCISLHLLHANGFILQISKSQIETGFLESRNCGGRKKKRKKIERREKTNKQKESEVLRKLTTMGIIGKTKEFLSSELQANSEKRQRNMQLLRSVALFVGSVFFMRQYGEVMVA